MCDCMCPPPCCSVEEFRFLRFRLDFNEYYATAAGAASAAVPIA